MPLADVLPQVWSGIGPLFKRSMLVEISSDAENKENAALAAWAAERERIACGVHWISPAGPRRRWRTRVFTAGVKLFATALRLTSLYERGRRNALTPALVALELRFPTLPAAFDGYRILHLSDTHLDALPELAPIARNMLSDVEVDLLALTGDVLAAHDAPPRRAVEPLAHALEGLVVHDRRLAVLGNHDPVAMVEALEKIGFEVLLNRSVRLDRGEDRIAVTGLDDVHQFYTQAAHAALFDGSADGGFRIALIHSPEMADYADAAGVSLYLCGHTHGGQICLPGGRLLITRLTRCRHAASGLWRQVRTVGYTSRGLGSSAPTLRFNCPGEITLITLRSGP